MTNNYSQLINTVNWHNPSWDLFIFGFWIAASVIYSFTAGRGRIINILISVYMAKLLVLEAPFLKLSQSLSDKLNFSGSSLQQLVAFVVVFLILFLFLGRYVFRTSADSKRLISILFSVVFSFLQIGLLINIILNYLPASVIYNFSPLIQILFIKSPASFIWLLAPLVFLMLLGKFVSDVTEV